jgi:hypothetical protein
MCVKLHRPPGDRQKAFVSVWHDILLQKIIHSGCNILFRNECTFQVSVGQFKSCICNIPYSVPHSRFIVKLFFVCNLAIFTDETNFFGSSH